MGSRRRTGGESARLPAPSRRMVLVGTTAAALSAPGPAGPMPAVAPASATKDDARPFQDWLSLNARIERLQARWAMLENWLAQEHSWLQLSPMEQRALPWAQELRDIDSRLDALFEKHEALLKALPAEGCASLEAIAAKLAVVERLIAPAEHREAHALIVGSRQDLIALIGAGAAKLSSHTLTMNDIA